ncbi:MAG TPA: AAA family ATPase [Edaphobacter sp.]|nr:AAA family ATPase [Edaphobacter sp.]
MTDIRKLSNSSLDVAGFAAKVKPATKAAPPALSPPQLQAIQAFAAQLRQNSSVAAPQNEGITFFTGSDHAAKTAAAQALAGDLHLELNRIDLKAMVSQYAGDTINALTQLLHSSAAAGAVLFLDEADVLFSKRTGVQDSHDKYAGTSNDDPIRRSALLQLLEQHPGLVILAVNSTDGWDPALLPRVHATLKFPPTP